MPIITFHNLLKTLNYLNKIQNFVQVGSHDGEMHDPLRIFVLNNDWRGILIDPQTNMLQKCKQNYHNKANLNFVNVAVHPTKSWITLYKVENPKDYSHSGWASIVPERFSNTIYKNSYSVKKVKAIPLMEVIKYYELKTVDLLQIDTEGFDWNVLKMYDFNYFKPVIIQYEHCHLSNNDFQASIQYLNRMGYLCKSNQNDTFALRKDLFNPIIIISYLFVRLSRSLQSRIF